MSVVRSRLPNAHNNNVASPGHGARASGRAPGPRPPPGSAAAPPPTPAATAAHSLQGCRSPPHAPATTPLCPGSRGRWASSSRRRADFSPAKWAPETWAGSRACGSEQAARATIRRRDRGMHGMRGMRGRRGIHWSMRRGPPVYRPRTRADGLGLGRSAQQLQLEHFRRQLVDPAARGIPGRVVETTLPPHPRIAENPKLPP
jgi:hypothetical protein